MTTFAIDTDNNIAAFASREDALNQGRGETTFASAKDLARLTADWPTSRFAEVWNGFAGVVPFDRLKPVRKFTDRKTAVNRIWGAVQVLTPAQPAYAAQGAPKKPRKAHGPELQKEPHVARKDSKKAVVLDLIRRESGATLQELMAATGWQAHSVRGFISGALGKKMGIAVESFRHESGERAYRAQR